MTTPTRSRRLIALSLALVATLGLVASACGDDKDDSSKSDSTSKPRESTTTEAPEGDDGSTETTAAAEQPFDEGVAQLQSKITDAKGDFCALLVMLSDDVNVEEPQTPEQVKVMIGVLSELLTAVGDAAGSSGEDLKAAATKLTAAAAAANYDKNMFDDPKLDQNIGLSAAIASVTSTAKEKCPEMFQDSSTSTP